MGDMEKKGEVLEKRQKKQAEAVDTLREALAKSKEQYGENDKRTRTGKSLSITLKLH